MASAVVTVPAPVVRETWKAAWDRYRSSKPLLRGDPHREPTESSPPMSKCQGPKDPDRLSMNEPVPMPPTGMPRLVRLTGFAVRAEGRHRARRPGRMAPEGAAPGGVGDVPEVRPTEQPDGVVVVLVARRAPGQARGGHRPAGTARQQSSASRASPAARAVGLRRRSWVPGARASIVHDALIVTDSARFGRHPHGAGRSDQSPTIRSRTPCEARSAEALSRAYPRPWTLNSRTGSSPRGNGPQCQVPRCSTTASSFSRRKARTASRPVVGRQIGVGGGHRQHRRPVERQEHLGVGVVAVHPITDEPVPVALDLVGRVADHVDVGVPPLVLEPTRSVGGVGVGDGNPSERCPRLGLDRPGDETSCRFGHGPSPLIYADGAVSLRRVVP